MLGCFRAWSGNVNARRTIARTMEANPGLVVTMPNAVQDESAIERALAC